MTSHNFGHPDSFSASRIVGGWLHMFVLSLGVLRSVHHDDHARSGFVGVLWVCRCGVGHSTGSHPHSGCSVVVRRWELVFLPVFLGECGGWTGIQDPWEGCPVFLGLPKDPL